MSEPDRVFSVGYERRELGEFLQVLAEHGVTKIVDVREAPVSRKRGFSKSALSEGLKSAGIEYRHVRAAGNPYRKRKASLAECLRLYRRYLKTHPEVVSTLADEIADGTTAMLCYERKHAECHRSVLLNALVGENGSLEIVKIE